MNIIIPEERLEEVFATLPVVEGFGNDPDRTPHFEFGSPKDLQRWLNDKIKRQEYRYPLVYLQTPIEAVGNHQKVICKDVVLILAHKSNKDMTPLKRLDTIIKVRLKPLAKNVIKALKTSGITKLLTDGPKYYSSRIYYNYSSTDEEQELNFPDVWDVIWLKCNLEISSGCVQEIIYN